MSAYEGLKTKHQPDADGRSRTNSVANYVPLDNYLAMVDEGRLYSM